MGESEGGAEPTGALGRRERKKRATRLALKAAAIDLVGERGYSNVTVEDIANAVDVSVRTFFNYFDSKEAAIVGDDPELVDELGAELVALPSELAPLEALRTVLVRRLEAIAEDIDRSGEDHQVWQRRFAVVRSQPEVLGVYAERMSMLEQVLTDALVRRLGGDEGSRPYVALVTATAMGVMRVVGSCWGGLGGMGFLVEFVDEAFDLIEAGLPRELAEEKSALRNLGMPLLVPR